MLVELAFALLVLQQPTPVTSGTPVEWRFPGAVPRLFQWSTDGTTWQTLLVPNHVPPLNPDKTRTYAATVPLMATGVHELRIRACDAAGCGSGSDIISVSFVRESKAEEPPPRAPSTAPPSTASPSTAPPSTPPPPPPPKVNHATVVYRVDVGPVMHGVKGTKALKAFAAALTAPDATEIKLYWDDSRRFFDTVTLFKSYVAGLVINAGGL